MMGRRLATATIAGIGLVATATLSVATARADQPPTLESDELAKSVQRLVDQIGSDEFFQRELAASQLHAMGPSVVPSLLRQMDIETDSERLLRLADITAKLQRQNDAAMQQRFLDGLHSELPGWRWFSSLMGDSASTRSLFVRMRQAYPDRTGKLDGTARDRGTVLRTSLAEIQMRTFMPRNNLGAAELLLVLLPLADASVPSNGKVDQGVASLLRQGAHRQLLQNAATKRNVSSLLGRWINRPERTAVQTKLSFGLSLNLPASLQLARTVLSEATAVDGSKGLLQQPGLAAAAMVEAGPMVLAMQTISLFGDPVDVPKLLRFLDDVRPTLGQMRRGDTVFATTVGDFAAATILAVQDWDPTDFGLPPDAVSPAAGINPDAIGFPSDDPAQRDANREAIRERLASLSER